MDSEFEVSRRKLPHYRVEGAIYFITFRLRRGSLIRDEIRLVLDHIREGDGRFYDLIAAIVMPDHVHLVLRPSDGMSLQRIMKGIKGVSARKINLGRGSAGELWQDESMDHIIRDAKDFEGILRYIQDNSVKAGLAEDGWYYEGFYCKPEIYGLA